MTCKFHPRQLYLHFPLLANSTPDSFTCIFHYLQIPPSTLYLHFPLLANSTPDSFTCIFHYLQIPPPTLYLHFPLLANSVNPYKCILNYTDAVHVSASS